MICYIIIAIALALSPLAYFIGHDIGEKIGRRNALKARENIVYQFGSTAYVSIENGRKMAIVTLDCDDPLTATDKLHLVEEVKKFLRKERANEKKP